MDKIAQIIKGVIWFFFGLAYSVLSYYVVPALVDFLPTTTLQAIFWVGLILTWILAIIIAPAVIITKAFQN